MKGPITIYFWLALIAFAISAVLIASYLGTCRSLVPGDTGGYHETWGLVFAVIMFVAGILAWRKRREPMQ